MPPADVDDWSDSDEELEADVETAVQLGIPDGPLHSTTDLSDPTVSRIGGHPTFLSPPPPPLAHATCTNCSQPMELLVQVWCPMEESPNDRALFVWGCANAPCQRKDGSVRAWRELRFNKKYAEKLEKKLARRKEKEAQRAKLADDTTKPAPPKSNPFALGAGYAPNPFGLGSQIFGGPDPEPEPASTEDESETESAERGGSPDDDDASSGTESESEDDGEREDEANADALAAAVQAASLDDSLWKSVPAYSSLYLTTVSEYLPPPPKVKVPAGAAVDDVDDDDKSSKKDGGGWTMEGYENSMDVDHAFERFTKRVSSEGEQCLRYELGGTPLPFSSDAVFDKLFPVPPAPPAPVTKASFMVTPPRKRSYVPAALPPCPHCRSRRVFECQLMPNLINVLRSPSKTKTETSTKTKTKGQTDEERRAEVLKALKGQSAGGRGMEWGTCMIFSCEKDCAAAQSEAGTGTGTTWREEYVLVQWDE